MKHNQSPEDREFMNSLSAAMMEHTPKGIRWVLYFWFITIFLFIVWASFTQIDEITRGTGKVVASGENRVVQNLEGGIVEKIYIKVGDGVKKGQPLLKIDNEKSEAQLDSTQIKLYELEAKISRLKAEAEEEVKLFQIPKVIEKLRPLLVANERSLYQSRKKQLSAKIDALEDRKRQKEHELNETLENIKHLQRTVSLIEEEVKMMKPMVKQGVKSKVAFMKLEQDQR